ncbi:DUF6531 domain-containing protein [Amycolatopsis nigrescens]|uniref:DUF6531 domain-containing protein n=1 Tax=Amycolatopsis nigrescens TaxID=381445 RepID=UPI0003A59594|nr:DUF6531 domain-containing protein [Amycolatopsis nigrescens]
MPEGNPLVAQAQSQTTGVTGIGILESANDLASGVKDGSWVEGGLGALGVGLEVLSMVVDPIGTLAQYGVSWLIEHVQPLKEALDWLAGDPPVIQSFSDTWANVAKEVNAVAGDLGNEAKTGTAGWTGEAGDAYRGSAAEQTDAIAGAATLADGISTGVMVMGQVVAAVRETVRDLVAELVGKLITWALEAAATLGFATPVIAAQATAAISSAISKISDLIRKLVKTIGNVTPKIRKIVDKLGEIIEKLSKLGKKIGGGGGTTPSAAKGGKKLDGPDINGGKADSPDLPGDGPGGPDGPNAGGPNGSRADGGKDGSLRKDAENPVDRSQEPVGRCGRREPIDMATGEMYLVQTDVELPGMLPLLLQRVHVSSYRAGRSFGPSWASTLDQRLEIDERGVCYAGPDGVILVYPAPPSDGGEVLAEEGARWPLTRREEGGYTLTQPRVGRVLEFAPERDGRAALAAVADRNGNRIEFEHGAAGEVTEVRHSGGYRIAVDTEAGLTRALRLRSDGRDGGDGEDSTDITLVRYGYDEGGRLTEVINSSTRPLRFEYDQAGRITRWTDRNGQWYAYTYDHTGRCVRTEGSGSALAGTMEYDLAERVTVETNSLGDVSRYHFNELHQLVLEVDPLGNETRFEWDRYHRLLAGTDPLGRVTRYSYDEQGNTSVVTHPDGTQTLAEHNEFALPTQVVDPDGGVWRRAYDERGNLTAVTDPAGATTRFGHDELGHPTEIVDALGNVRRLRTDAAGLAVAVSDSFGATTHYQRDQFGRVVAITDPLGGTTRLAWTIEGKLLSRTQPSGATETWRYDSEGNDLEYVDPMGQVTRTRTTHFDLPAVKTGPDGTSLRYEYDSELRLVAVTNAQGLVWRYDHDAAGRLIRETDFNGRVLSYQRDASGQLVGKRNGAGQAVSYRRDPLGRVLEESSDAGISRFEYDPMGRMVRAANPHAELLFQRDRLGRVLAETVNGRTLTSEYDALGRRIRRTTPTGAVSSWSYDGNNQPTTLSSAGRSISFGYDPIGREVERLLDSGTIVAQAWDADHRLLSQTVSTVAQQTTVARQLQRRSYQYRADGYLQSVVDQLDGASRLDLDAAGRVTSVQGSGWAERYSYDTGGNIVAAAFPASDQAAQGRREYSGTLLRQAGGSSYSYDAQGRVVLRQKKRLSHRPDVWQYAWDADDRMVGAITPDGTRWRYSYDALGRRIAKQRLGPDGESVAEQVDFVWDGTLLAEQIHSAGLATTWDHEPGTFRPLTQTERVPARDAAQSWVDERFYSIVTDLVGTPAELVDPGGALAWHGRSTLWGETWSAPDGRASTPLRFPGQYHDAETGFNYNYQRYYDPETGRYNTEDPLGLAPSPNPRAYVANPTRWIDPLGLTPAPSGGCGTGTHETPPPPPNNGPISMDEAVRLGSRHVGGEGRVIVSGSDAYQFVRHSEDAAGRRISSIARFDINPTAGDVIRNGPHLNLETQINGRPVRTGPYADPHIPIDPTTIRPGDIPPPRTT